MKNIRQSLVIILLQNSWTDKRTQTQINFLVNLPKRFFFFLEIVDTSKYVKIDENICELVDKIVW